MSDDFESVSGGDAGVARYHSQARAPVSDGPYPVQTRVSGGVVRVMSERGEAAAARPYVPGPANRVHTGALSYTAGDDEVKSLGSRPVNAGDGGEVDGAAHDRFGRTITGRHLQAGDQLRHGGMSVPVEVAAKMGLLEVAASDARGRAVAWRAPASESPSHAPPPAQEQESVTEDSGELADEYGLEESELAAHASVAEAVGERGLDILVNSIIDNMDRIDDLDIEIIAPGKTEPSADLGMHTRRAVEGMRREAVRAITARGVDPTALYEHFRKNDPNMLRAVMKTTYESGDGRTFASLLVDRYKRGARSV